MKNSIIEPDTVNFDTGLTTKQVEQQIDSGNENVAQNSLTRSVKEILKANIITPFNFINIALGILVFYTGSYKNLLFLGIAFFNTAIGIIQELRSKRQIDKMAILAESTLSVLRNGQTVELKPEELVLSDVLLLKRGDQVPVDGKVITSRQMEVDESQITGESTTITKQVGDDLISGSFLVSGSGKMSVTKVGKDTFVNHISDEARKGETTKSFLLTTINKIIKVLTIVIVPLGVALFISKCLAGTTINRSILGSVAAMIGMIPEGLVLLTSVTLAISALNLARKRTLVRELPAIETLARVDTICLDKTGTITSGQLKYVKTISLNPSWTNEQIKQIAAGVIIGTGDTNETATAIKEAIADPQLPIKKAIPFSSLRKWSGVEFADDRKFVFGAPQFIANKFPLDEIKQYADQGLRILMLAQVDQLNDDVKKEQPKLLGMILISDVIRPNARDTFNYFRRQGVDIKVISGDDPATVSAIAKQAEIKNADHYIDMSTVTDEDFKTIVNENTVFGRVSPDQKQNLVKALQNQEHIVAMTGDGVNDLLAIRQADCGIAMASGSESTKSIADFVLIDSNFDAMIGVLNEGRRVINNIERVASMYLIKTMYSVALSLLFIFVASGYPFEPIQLTPITTLMVGIPSFFLALQPNFKKISNQFFKNVMVVSIPAATTIVSYILLIELLGKFFNLNYTFTSTLSVLITGSVSWLALIVVSKPFNKFKLFLVSSVMIAFLIIILGFNNLFSLVSFAEPKIWCFAIPLIFTAYFIFKGLQKIFVWCFES